MNPPFSYLNLVVNKIHNEGARAILIMPQWDDHSYFKDVQHMILRKCVYPEGSRVFERKGGATAGIRWPLWAVLVDGKEFSGWGGT